MRFNDREDLAGKIAWEGGFNEAMEYGIRIDDMPEDDIELANAWQILDITWGTYVKARDRVRNLLPEEYQDQI